MIVLLSADASPSCCLLVCPSVKTSAHLQPGDPQRPSVLRVAVRMMSLNRNSSISSQASDGRTHVLLHNVGRTIQRTGSQLRRTRLFHIFYLFVLPIYTLFGAWLFQTLDGEHDERLRAEYEIRCKWDREMDLAQLQSFCEDNPGASCFEHMRAYLNQTESCYRAWHAKNRTITHSMADFSNALIYAFSVYTTIGYGNMAADTVNCRIATIFYGAFGIPLFFAFVKEEGNLFRDLFIAAYKFVRRLKRRLCKQCKASSTMTPSPEHFGQGNCLGVPTPTYGAGGGSPQRDLEALDPVPIQKKARCSHISRQNSANSLLGGTTRHNLLDEQRKVFIAGCVVFILYIMSISWLVMVTTEFDYFTAMYFLFNSVALIGFGDVFPSNPRVIIFHAAFMVLGVVLFSMCYFILQEEIREKAFEASRKARISISKYGHTIMAQARSPWSRRNSPLFDHSENGTANGGSGNQSNFDRLKKRRQSAPAIALTGPGGKTRFRDI